MIPRSKLLLVVLAGLMLGGCAWLERHPATADDAGAAVDRAALACALIDNNRDRQLCEVLAELGAVAFRSALDAALAAEAADAGEDASCPATPSPAASSPQPDAASSPPAPVAP